MGAGIFFQQRIFSIFGGGRYPPHLLLEFIPMIAMRFATQILFLLWLMLIGHTALWAQRGDADSPAKAPRPKSGFLIDTVYFRFDSDVLQDEYKMALDSMVGIFTEYPAYYVEIFGHTDSIGSNAYNLKLSQDRARQIVLYLVDQGVALERMVYEGLGTEKPVGNNKTYRGRRKNRRADVAVIFSTETVQPVYETAPPVATVDSSTLNQEPVIMTDTIRCSYDPFVVKAERRTVVIAPQGTQLTVPPGAFDTDEAEVQLQVGELQTRRDMIVAKMHTVSRDGPLETAGMFSFEARAKGRPVKVRDSVAFSVSMPTTRRSKNMTVYEGRAERTRRRRRRGGTKQEGVPGDKPSMAPVREWVGGEDANVRYNGRSKVYLFSVANPGSFTVARPLHEATITDREDKGIDILVKFKGKVIPESMNAMLVGEVIRTSVPLKAESKRIYQSLRTKFLSEETDLMIIAYEFDDRGRAYWTKLNFKPSTFLNRKAKPNPRKRPQIKLKLKFRRIDPEELNQRLLELNV